MSDAGWPATSELSPLTHATVLVVIPVLLAAGLILFLFPGHTHTLWAWTIKSRMTAMAIGGGYLSGGALLLWALRAKTWADLVVGLTGASLLTALLLGTTVLHWDEFNHRHPAFWIWTGVYAITPVLLPIVIVTNQRRVASLPRPDSPRVRAAVRVAATMIGIAQAAVVAVMYVRPSALISHWPWHLTPLTARVIASFLAFIATVWLAFAVTDRWTVLRRPVAGAAIGLLAVGIGALRATKEFAPLPDSATLIFAVLLTGALGGLVALLAWMRVAGRRLGPQSAPATATTGHHAT